MISNEQYDAQSTIQHLLTFLSSVHVHIRRANFNIVIIPLKIHKLVISLNIFSE